MSEQNTPLRRAQLAAVESIKEAHRLVGGTWLGAKISTGHWNTRAYVNNNGTFTVYGMETDHDGTYFDVDNNGNVRQETVAAKQETIHDAKIAKELADAVIKLAAEM